MRVITQRIYSKPNTAKIVEWIRLIAITGGAQIGVQAIGFLSGILVIRLLPTKEYALYTLVNTMLGTMTVLADGGISTGVMAAGGRVWKDKEELGTVLNTGLELRKKFAIISLLITIPLLIFLLQHHGSSWLMTCLIVLSLVPAFITALSNAILQIPLKLRQDISPLQANEIGVSIGRIASLITIFAFPWAYIAILASGIPQAWANIRLRKISSNYVDWSQKTSSVIEKEIFGFVKRTLPATVYYCLSGQITIWLISIFGTTSSVAQLGALGRVGMLFSLLSILFARLITPRFARLKDKKEKLTKLYIQISIALFFISLCTVLFIYVFSTEILWVLGNKYHHLNNVLILSAIGSSLNLIAGCIYGLYSSKGWILHPFLNIFINILSIICSILIFDVSSLKGILYLNIFVSAIQVFMHQIFGYFKIRRIDNI